ncbi:nectin-3-like protein [Pleuronectes platessa]|uniref:nectin-3-like protein n=1 Tax=Pleuronectes platessa TaxID=8262 RepID=UPI00232A571F|nr:nectin-3-like protein [Pleuronectes platessa]
MQLIVVAEEVPPHTVEPALIPGPAAGGCAAFPNMSPSSHRSYRGGHGVVAFLHVLLSITGLCCSQVVVPHRVSAVLGKNVTLECRVEMDLVTETNLTLTQSSWERRLPSGSVTLAVYSPKFGSSIPELSHRLHFRSPSFYDATIVLENVGFADVGIYTCKAATFPMGNFQASTTLNVLVEPKVYVSAGSTALIDGGNETVVATCIAERARPPAEVSWESNLFGQSEVQLFDEVNGTTSTQVRYLWQPTRHVQGHALTCVVRHPALLTDFRIPYQINVQFAPDISVVGYDGDWFVGRENVQMTCKANANPPAHHFRWIRLDSEMPEGVEIRNSTLLFLRPLQRKDSGVYRCEVANDINLRSRDVRILIQDPPTMPSTITAPVLAGSDSSTLVDDKGHVLLISPTREALPESNLGSVVGGAVGGTLFLLLLLSIVGVYYLRKQQTFHGNYSTQPYLGPNHHQKAPTQHELRPTKAGSSSFRRDHDREEWGDRQLKQEHSGYNGEEYPPNGFTRAMRESSHLCKEQNHQREHTQYSSPRQARLPHPPKPQGNGSSYQSDDCYDSGTDADYVSHTDGSVISQQKGPRSPLQLLSFVNSTPLVSFSHSLPAGQSQAERSNAIAVAGAVMGAVLALFLVVIVIIVILTARKAQQPAFTDKVIDLPPTHKPPPPYSERPPVAPLGVHASQVAWLCQNRKAERRYGLSDGQCPPPTRQRPQSPTQQLSRLEWACHQSGTDRVYINRLEHYV